MDLGVAGIGKGGTTLVGAPGRGDIAATGIGGEVEDIAIAAGTEQHGIGCMALDFSRDEVAGDDPLGMPIDENKVEHLRVLVHLHPAKSNLGAQRGIGSEEKLLSGLAPCVEGSGNLGSSKGTVGQLSAVFSGKGYSLGDAFIDDIAADLGEAIDIGLAGAKIPALDGVVKKTPDTVTIVLVVLGGVDAPLGGDAVGAEGAVLKTEAINLVTEFRKGSGGGGSGEPRSDNNDVEFPFVGRIDQLRVVLEVGPLLLERTGWDFSVEYHDEKGC